MAVATTGKIYAANGETASESPWSDQDWTNPAFFRVDDGNPASVTSGAFDTGKRTYVGKVYNFDLSVIPDGATIDGVIVYANCWYANGTGSLDLCQLTDTDRAKVGDNKASTPIPLTTNDTEIIELGADDDTWNNELTSAWVKNTNFAVAFGFIATGDNCDIYVDDVSLEVFYTPSGGGGSIQASIDALLQKRATVSLSIDALLSAAATLTTGLDALLSKGEAKTLSLDAVLKKNGISSTVSIDALLSQAGLGTVSLDAILASIHTKEVSLDALLQQAGNTFSCDIDALLQKSASASVSLDALIQGAVSKTLSIDALLSSLGLTASTSIDALLTQQGLTAQVTLDAILITDAGGMETVSLDALLTSGGTKILSLDGLLQQSALVTAVIDAVLTKTLTASVSLDAVVSKPGISMTVSLDAILQSAIAPLRTFTAKTQVFEFAADTAPFNFIANKVPFSFTALSDNQGG